MRHCMLMTSFGVAHDVYPCVSDLPKRLIHCRLNDDGQDILPAFAVPMAACRAH